VTDAKIAGTLWENDVKDDNVKLDERELEELFTAVAKVKSVPAGVNRLQPLPRTLPPHLLRLATGAGGVRGTTNGGAPKEEKKKMEVVNLVDPKTANNTAIAISRFKMTPVET